MTKNYVRFYRNNNCNIYRIFRLIISRNNSIKPISIKGVHRQIRDTVNLAHLNYSGHRPRTGTTRPNNTTERPTRVARRSSGVFSHPMLARQKCLSRSGARCHSSINCHRGSLRAVQSRDVRIAPFAAYLHSSPCCRAIRVESERAEGVVAMTQCYIAGGFSASSFSECLLARARQWLH